VGILIYDQHRRLIKQVSRFIGKATNNVAEYMALIYALEEALYLKTKLVECFLDSQLLVRQLQGSYRVRNENLRPLYYKVRHLEDFFEKVSFHHIKRDENRGADRLAKEAAIKERGNEVVAGYPKVS